MLVTLGSLSLSLPLEWLHRTKKERCFQQRNGKEISSLFPKFTPRIRVKIYHYERFLHVSWAYLNKQRCSSKAGTLVRPTATRLLPPYLVTLLVSSVNNKDEL